MGRRGAGGRPAPRWPPRGWSGQAGPSGRGAGPRSRAGPGGRSRAGAPHWRRRERRPAGRGGPRERAARNRADGRNGYGSGRLKLVGLSRCRRRAEEDEPRSRVRPQPKGRKGCPAGSGVAEERLGQDDQGPRAADGCHHPARHGLGSQPAAAVPGLDGAVQEQGQAICAWAYHCKRRLGLGVSSLQDRLSTSSPAGPPPPPSGPAPLGFTYQVSLKGGAGLGAGPHGYFAEPSDQAGAVQDFEFVGHGPTSRVMVSGGISRGAGSPRRRRLLQAVCHLVGGGRPSLGIRCQAAADQTGDERGHFHQGRHAAPPGAEPTPARTGSSSMPGKGGEPVTTWWMVAPSAQMSDHRPPSPRSNCGST